MVVRKGTVTVAQMMAERDYMAPWTKDEDIFTVALSLLETRRVPNLAEAPHDVRTISIYATKIWERLTHYASSS